MSDFPKLFEGHYEYLLREVLESIDDTVVVFNHEHIVIYANGGAEDVFGRSISDLTGQDIKTLIPKDKGEYFNNIMTTLSNSGHHELQLHGKHEFIGLRSPDHIFYAEGKLSKLKDDLAFVLVLKDITLRKAAEAELQIALSHLRNAGSKVAYRIEHPSILDEFPVD